MLPLVVDVAVEDVHGSSKQGRLGGNDESMSDSSLEIGTEDVPERGCKNFNSAIHPCVLHMLSNCAHAQFARGTI